MPQYSSLIREMALGPLEGRPRGMLHSAAAREHAASGAPPRPMETHADVARRAAQFWGQLQCGVLQAAVAKGAATDLPGVLVVSHGGFLHTLLEGILGAPDLDPVRNCSISAVRLGVTGGEVCSCTLLALNDTSHLDDGLVSASSVIENF